MVERSALPGPKRVRALSLVAMTSPRHGEGRRFESGRAHLSLFTKKAGRKGGGPRGSRPRLWRSFALCAQTPHTPFISQSPVRGSAEQNSGMTRSDYILQGPLLLFPSHFLRRAVPSCSHPAEVLEDAASPERATRRDASALLSEGCSPVRLAFAEREDQEP